MSAATASLALLLHSANTLAQNAEDGLVFYPTKIEAILDLDYSDRNSNNGDSTEQEWDLGARIKQEAYYLDPGIARFLFDIEPVVSVDKYESGTTIEDRDGELLNYLLQANLLRDTPGAFAVDLNAQRNSEVVTGSLGSRSDNKEDSVQGLLKWNNEAFPMSLNIKRVSLDQSFESTPGTTISEREEEADSWTLTGQSSKLKIQLDHLKLDDRIVSRDNDFEQDQASLSHRLEWGKGSSLSSRLNAFDRSGFNANERVNLEEAVHLQHTDQLFSRTSYQYNSIKQNIDAEENILKFQLNHKLFHNLTTVATLDLEDNESNIQDERIRGIDVDSRYHKRDFMGASVFAGLGLGYQETERDSSSGLLDIVNESHLVPLNGAFILDNRFIIVSSIIVTDSNATTVYTLGSDYDVNSVGGNLTEIQVIPGGQINDGDTLLVSYQATVLPSQEFSTTRLRYSLGANFGWIRFSHSDRRNDNDLSSGASELYLNDSRQTTTDINLRDEIGDTELSFDAQRRFSSSAGFDTTTYTYRQMLIWQAGAGSRLDLSLTESFIEQSIRETDLYSLRLSLDWRPQSKLSIRPVAVLWKRKDKDRTSGDQQDDEFLNLGFTMIWRYRKIIMELDYYHNERDVNSTQFGSSRDSEEDRIMFTLTRRFY